MWVRMQRPPSEKHTTLPDRFGLSDSDMFYHLFIPAYARKKKTLIHIGPFFSIPPGESLFPTTVSPDSRGNEILLYHYSTKHTNRRQDVASPDSVSILLRAQISRRVLLNHLQEDSGPQPASRAERSPCHSIWQSYNLHFMFPNIFQEIFS